MPPENELSPTNPCVQSSHAQGQPLELKQRAQPRAPSGRFADDRLGITSFMPRHFVGLSCFLLVLAIGFGWGLKQSLQRFSSDALQGLLAGHAESIERWLGERIDDAGQIASQPEVLNQASALLNASEPVEPDAASMTALLLSDEYTGWCVVTLQSEVVATDLPSLSKTRLGIPDDAWKTLVARQPAIALPFPSPSQAGGKDANGTTAWMAAMVPLVDGARTTGALMLMIDPQTTFLPLATSGWIGESGQSYAFDANGLLVSPVRFLHSSVNRPSSGENQTGAGMLTASVRLPVGGSTIALNQVQQALPLTWMADQATRGGTGTNVDGYEDFRGEKVIGSWTWLSDYKLGLATETTVREAYRALSWLRWITIASLLSLAGLQCYAQFSRVRAQRVAKQHHSGTKTRILGPYELGGLIGRGGMGAVYHARHRRLGREVAIKILEGEEVNALSVSRFEREVTMTSRLRHPNTIEIYDYGVIGNETYYYVMEYVDGITLQELIEDFGPQPPSRVIHLLLQICGSLSEAHQSGMIHRDIKPSNILLTARAGLYDMVKVLDFGLVREVDRETTELTQTDGITGTPMYMSPESVRDATKADEKSDLYSSGAVGYTLLTGLPTFDGDSSVDVCLKQLNDEPARPSDRLGEPLPDDLQNLLMSCLRKEPDERPHTMDELESSLRQCGDSGDWTAADALRWWEIDFQGRLNENAGKSLGSLTNRTEAIPSRDSDGPQAATGDSGTTTVH